MGILDTLESCFVVSDDLLDFTLEGEGEKEEKEDPKTILKSALSSPTPKNTTSFTRGTRSDPFPEFVEEELEWLSNKDAFPSVETCFGILSDNPELISNHHHRSPVSVLENTNPNGNANGCLAVPTNFPVRVRSSSRRRKRSADYGELLSQQCLRPNRVHVENKLAPSGSIGKRCLHCQVDKTPQWRAGPMGPKTLCNACGVRYKSGRLLPEYRPANSPTFSSALHSNSHRKVVEMRKQKQMATEGGSIW